MLILLNFRSAEYSLRNSDKLYRQGAGSPIEYYRYFCHHYRWVPCDPRPLYCAARAAELKSEAVVRLPNYLPKLQPLGCSLGQLNFDFQSAYSKSVYANIYTIMLGFLIFFNFINVEFLTPDLVKNGLVQGL